MGLMLVEGGGPDPSDDPPDELAAQREKRKRKSSKPVIERSYNRAEVEAMLYSTSIPDEAILEVLEFLDWDGPAA
jgi:hypothetical protein